MGKSRSDKRAIFFCKACKHFFFARKSDTKPSYKGGQRIKAHCEYCDKPTDCTVTLTGSDPVVELEAGVRELFS